MIAKIFGPLFALYALLVGVGLSAAWLVHRTRARAARDEDSMSEATCAARTEMLLRGLPEVGNSCRRR